MIRCTQCDGEVVYCTGGFHIHVYLPGEDKPRDHLAVSVYSTVSDEL